MFRRIAAGCHPMRRRSRSVTAVLRQGHRIGYVSLRTRKVLRTLYHPCAMSYYNDGWRLSSVRPSRHCPALLGACTQRTRGVYCHRRRNQMAAH